MFRAKFTVDYNTVETEKPNLVYEGIFQIGMGNANSYCVLIYGPGALNLGIPDRILTHSNLDSAQETFNCYVCNGLVKKVSILQCEGWKVIQCFTKDI